MRFKNGEDIIHFRELVIGSQLYEKDWFLPMMYWVTDR